MVSWRHGNFTFISIDIIFTFAVLEGKKNEDDCSLYSPVFILTIFCIYIVFFILKSERGFETLVWILGSTPIM